MGVFFVGAEKRLSPSRIIGGSRDEREKERNG